MSWTEAEDYCRNKSGHLASVTSNTTNDYIVGEKNKRGLNRLWIGGSDLENEGSWKWADGSPWESTLWKSDEPNNYLGAQNCLNYHPGNDQLWDDELCIVQSCFLCSRTICPDETQQEIWSSPTFVAIGASGIAFILVLLLIAFLYVIKRQRNKRKAADVTRSDENPVYGTYFDPDPKAEVADDNAY